MNKYWHYLTIVAIFFVCLYVYNAQTLKGVPVVGPYLSR